MKKLISYFTAIFLIFIHISTSLAQETKLEKDARMAWWRDATFGMFIHWGLYAIPAGEYNGKTVGEGKIGEWIQHTLNIPNKEYEKFAGQFNPIYFDAKEWVSIAKNAGMKYIVITSKHHDGFCLWDSKVSTYDIMDASPYQKDILMELKNACDEAGIKLCFYHSIMDWHHPDAESPKDYKHQNNPNANWANYRETYLKPQLKELITKYHPAVLWFDGEWIPEWTEDQGKDLYNYLMKLDPNLIINNRIGKGRKGMSGMNKYEDAAGDFGTPEQEILEGTSTMDWESCMTMNDTWGYRKDDFNWKTSEQLITNLIDVAAKGGNYLLNIGPMATGKIPEASIERLYNMGAWLKINGEAIYATNSWKTFKEENIYFTQNGDYVYAIATKKPENGKLLINSVEPLQTSEILHLSSGKNPSWEMNPSNQLEINVMGIQDFGYGQVFKIKIK